MQKMRIIKYLDLFYVFFVYVISNFLNNQIILSILAVPLIVIIPLLAGHSLLFFDKDLLKNRLFLLYSWIFGFLVLLSLSYLLTVFNLFSINFVILIITFTSFFIKYHFNFKNSYNSLRLYWEFLILIINASMVFFVIRSFSPFPLQPGGDIFIESLISNKILEWDFFKLLPIEYSKSILLSPKINSWPLLMATIMGITKANFLSLTWLFPFFFLIIHSLAVYILSYILLGSRFFSTLSAVLSIWIMEVNKPSIMYSLQSSLFIPFFVFGLIFVLYEKFYLPKNLSSKKFLYIILFIIFYLSLHIILGGLMIIFLISFLFSVYFLWKYDSFRKIYSLIAFTLAIFSILILLRFISLVQLSNFNINILTTFGNIPPNSKIYFFDSWYTIPLLSLSLIGSAIATVRLYLYKTTQYDFTFLFLLSVQALLILLVFLPISNIIRIYPFFNPLIPISLSFIIFQFIKLKRNNKINLLVSMLLILFIFLNLVTPLLQYTTNLRKDNCIDGFSSSFTKNELEVSNWLKHNFNSDNTIVVSDPETQKIIEGISLIPTYKGAYVEKDTHLMMTNIFKENSSDMHKDLNSVILQYWGYTPDNIILVVSDRTNTWVGVSTNVYRPKKTNRININLNKLNDKKNYELLKNLNNETFVYKVL